MVTRLIDEEPDLAARHARRAHDLAPRIASVREALAVAAYRNGDYRTALREARTVRRMSGDESWLPLVADCERGLGRSDRALELLQEVDLKSLPVEIRAECLIVLSGVRRDLGQMDAALAVLDTDLLRARKKSEWSARLRLAYAETLAEAGRGDEAERWLRLAVASDPEGTSGAADVLADWEGVDVIDMEDDQMAGLDDEDEETDQETDQEGDQDAANDDSVPEPGVGNGDARAGVGHGDQGTGVEANDPEDGSEGRVRVVGLEASDEEVESEASDQESRLEADET